jgi:ADP-heptose:LPS heptosyltransferase
MRNDPRRILIFRALQLGDMLCSVPALRALREAHEAAEVTLLGLPWARALLRHVGRYVDRFEEFPGHPGISERDVDWSAWPGLLARVQAAEPDVVIQMHGSGRISNAICRRLGGRLHAGYYDPGWSAPPQGHFLAYPEQLPEIRRHLALMEFLGCPARGEEIEFEVAAEDEAALWLLPELAGLGEAPYAVLHPGARAAARRWDPGSFAQVADHLADLGLQIVITGTPAEAGVTRAVRQAMKAPAVDTARLDLPLGALAALVAPASVVICNDTGVSHLASALRVPSVVIFLASDPGRWAPLDAERHRALTPAMGLSERRVVDEAKGVVRWASPRRLWRL